LKLIKERATKGKEDTDHNLKVKFNGQGSKVSHYAYYKDQISYKDPLKICVLSTDHYVFVQALYGVKTLLQKVYKEREEFCGETLRIRMKQQTVSI